MLSKVPLVAGCESLLALWNEAVEHMDTIMSQIFNLMLSTWVLKIWECVKSIVSKGVELWVLKLKKLLTSLSCSDSVILDVSNWNISLLCVVPNDWMESLIGIDGGGDVVWLSLSGGRVPNSCLSGPSLPFPSLLSWKTFFGFQEKNGNSGEVGCCTVSASLSLLLCCGLCT